MEPKQVTKNMYLILSYLEGKPDFPRKDLMAKLKKMENMNSSSFTNACVELILYALIDKYRAKVVGNVTSYTITEAGSTILRALQLR